MSGICPLDCISLITSAPLLLLHWSVLFDLLFELVLKWGSFLLLPSIVAHLALNSRHTPSSHHRLPSSWGTSMPLCLDSLLSTHLYMDLPFFSAFLATVVRWSSKFIFRKQVGQNCHFSALVIRMKCEEQYIQRKLFSHTHAQARL